MNGLQFINHYDPLNRWTVQEVLDIASLIDDYCKSSNIKNAELCSVESNCLADPENQRYDIEICYSNEAEMLIRQKLLILKGEVVDGKEFHKRFKEFYKNPFEKDEGGSNEEI